MQFSIVILIPLKCLLINLLLAVEVISDKNPIQLEGSLIGNGFHREITTVLVIPAIIQESLSKNFCKLLLVETLPSGVYADPYQLSSLRAFGGPKAVFEHPVNVEAPEFMSSSLKVYIYLNVADNKSEASEQETVINVTFPIHARYHKPSMEETHTTVTVKHPSLYSNCSSPDVEGAITAPCDADSATLCFWLPLAFMKKSYPLTLQVPIGQEPHKPMVILLTLLVTVAVSGLLVKALWTSHQNMHDKHS